MRRSDRERHRHDDWSDRIGHQVTDDDSTVAGTDRAGGFDELLLLQAQNSSADQSGGTHPAD